MPEHNQALECPSSSLAQKGDLDLIRVGVVDRKVAVLKASTIGCDMKNLCNRLRCLKITESDELMSKFEVI